MESGGSPFSPVKREIGKRDWASYVGVIPHASMGSVYARAEVVLNTSKSEGLSNTVIEAMWCGAIVMASDIPGNRTAIRDRVTGFLYRDQMDFRETLQGLLRYPSKMGVAAKEYARDHFSSERETADLLQMYNDLA